MATTGSTSGKNASGFKDTAKAVALVTGELQKLADIGASASPHQKWRGMSGSSLTTPINKGGKEPGNYQGFAFDEYDTKATEGIGPLKDGEQYARDLKRSQKKEKKKKQSTVMDRY